MDTIKTIRIGALLMMIGVIIGAFGAHGLKPRLEVSSFSAFKTGIEYHFMHSMAIILIGVLQQQFHLPKIKYCTYAFLAGILCFSGSLFFLSTKSLTGIDWFWLGPVTPIGGIFFIMGWLWLVVLTFGNVFKMDVTKKSV